MLCLQNGKFDHADRMFYSVAQTWSSALASPADVKELIPEFYSSDGSFLLNEDNLELGTLQTGAGVGDVVLPAWSVD